MFYNCTIYLLFQSITIVHITFMFIKNIFYPSCLPGVRVGEDMEIIQNKKQIQNIFFHFALASDLLVRMFRDRNTSS